MKKERIEHVREQLAIIRTYSEHYIAEYNEGMLYWYDQGLSVGEIAKLFGWKERSMKSQITKLLNERNPKPVDDEPELKLKY